LESARYNPSEIKRFTKEIRELGIQYVGLCCGYCPAMFRELAEVYGRTPQASKYAPGLSLSNVFGTPSGKKDMDERLRYGLSC